MTAWEHPWGVTHIRAGSLAEDASTAAYFNWVHSCMYCSELITAPVGGWREQPKAQQELQPPAS